MTRFAERIPSLSLTSTGPKSLFGEISLLQCTGQNHKKPAAHSSFVHVSRVKGTAISGEDTLFCGHSTSKFSLFVANN
jgi:hypothetical protein